jgi:hypothetical protein
MHESHCHGLKEVDDVVDAVIEAEAASAECRACQWSESIVIDQRRANRIAGVLRNNDKRNDQHLADRRCSVAAQQRAEQRGRG